MLLPWCQGELHEAPGATVLRSGLRAGLLSLPDSIGSARCGAAGPGGPLAPPAVNRSAWVRPTAGLCLSSFAVYLVTGLPTASLGKACPRTLTVPGSGGAGD